MLADQEFLEVLGARLPLQDVTTAELDNRIALACRKFWALKALLLNTGVSRNRRLQVFDASVGSSFLYGAHAWTPREEELRKIRPVQNRMLRRICGIRRFSNEEWWLPWIQRVTNKSRQIAVEAGVRDWVETHALRKWCWAGHVARRCASTWLWRVTFWRDSDWNRSAIEDGGVRLLRSSRRRWMKWEDPLRRFVTWCGDSSWSAIALDRSTWESKAECFVQWYTGGE